MTADCSVDFFAPYTEHVGTRATFERLADGLADAGYDVRLIRAYREWCGASPTRLCTIGATWSRTAIDRLPFPWKKLVLAGTAFTGLVRHLNRDPPDVLVAGLLSGVAIAAREVSDADTQVVVSVQGLPRQDRVRGFLWPRLYPRADALVAPVDSLADRLASIADVPAADVEIVPNPVVTDEVIDRGEQPPDHGWFDDDVPVIVGLGRQTEQKDFATLLRSFAALKAERDVRLVVPGKEGEKSDLLFRLIDELNLGDCVDFPGFVENQYSYIGAADVFVLSSRWEGPGHVLIEALSLGTPVVSTECPLGPRELLRDGIAGVLVPVGDPQAIAEGFRTVLDDPATARQRVEAGRTVAEKFRVDAAVRGYRNVVDPLCRDR